MTFFLILAFSFFLIFINRFVYKKFINFPSIITLIWGLSLAFSTLGLYDTYVPPDSVIVYALIFVLGINIFSMVFNRLMPSKNKKEKEAPSISISNKVLTGVLIACSILLLVTLWDGFLMMMETGDFSEIRNAYINYETVGTHFQVLISVTLIPIGRAASVIAIVDLVHNRKLKSSFLMAVAFSVLCMMLTGGRSTLFFLVLIFVIALYDKEKSIARIIRNNFKALIAIITTAIVLLVVTFQRGFADNSIMQSVYVYFAGCFNLFGVYLEGAAPFTPLLYGQALFSGITFPLIEGLRFLGIDILPGNYILAQEATAKYIPISPRVAINATPTTMYPAMRDFGEAGLVIYPATICLVFQWLKNRCFRNNNIMNKSLFINFIASALLLNMAFQFGTFQSIAVFIYIIIICKGSDYISSRKKKVE